MYSHLLHPTPKRKLNFSINFIIFSSIRSTNTSQEVVQNTTLPSFQRYFETYFLISFCIFTISEQPDKKIMEITMNPWYTQKVNTTDSIHSSQ